MNSTSNYAMEMVSNVIETRKWAKKTSNTSNGKDYHRLKELYPMEQDYNYAKNLYWHLAFKNLGTWEHYLQSSANKQHQFIFDNYLLPGVLA
jgi:hypothetical protein